MELTKFEKQDVSEVYSIAYESVLRAIPVKGASESWLVKGAGELARGLLVSVRFVSVRVYPVRG